MTEWAKKFGPIYTVWGTKPVVIVNTYDYNFEANIVKKNDFIDRPNNILREK